MFIIYGKAPFGVFSANSAEVAQLRVWARK